MRSAVFAFVVAMAGLATVASAQTLETTRTVYCPRQATVNGVTFTVSASSRCRMKFQLPAGFNAMVARRKDTGATLVRVDCPSAACTVVSAGVQVEVAVPYPIGLPQATEVLDGELVAFRPATEFDNPALVSASNTAPFVESLPQGFTMPALTVAQFLSAFVGF